jgi:hypothetical protein
MKGIIAGVGGARTLDEAEVAVIGRREEALVEGRVGRESGGFAGREAAAALEGGGREERRMRRHGDAVSGVEAGEDDACGDRKWKKMRMKGELVIHCSLRFYLGKRFCSADRTEQKIGRSVVSRRVTVYSGPTHHVPYPQPYLLFH